MAALARRNQNRQPDRSSADGRMGRHSGWKSVRASTTGPSRAFFIIIRFLIEDWDYLLIIQLSRMARSAQSLKHFIGRRKSHLNWVSILWTSSIATDTWDMNS